MKVEFEEAEEPTFFEDRAGDHEEEEGEQEEKKEETEQKKRKREEDKETEELERELFLEDEIASSSRTHHIDKVQRVSVTTTTTKKKKKKKGEEEEEDREEEAPKAAWVDEDDGATEVSLKPKKLRKLRTAEDGDEKDVTVDGDEYQARLRAQLSKVTRQQVGWAAIREGDGGEDEEGEKLLQKSSAKVATREGGVLKPGFVSISRMADGNSARRAESGLTSVRFHPRRGDLFMAASLDRTVSLFEVDGRTNPHVATAELENLPVCAAEFSSDGSEIVATGLRPFFYVIDVATGRASKVARVSGRMEHAYPKMSASREFIALHGGAGSEAVILSARSKQLVGTARTGAGSLDASAFSEDGNVLYLAGAGGEVFEWDVRMMRCARKWADEGSTRCTALAASPASRYFAVGSTSGVVNVYSGESLASSAVPKRPIKALMNVTTQVDHVAFNPDSQLLCVTSHVKREVLKLVHLPSCTVFGNWPNTSVILKHVSCVGFSPNGGLLAVGNEKGRALFFRLCHWSTA